jgi:hypothetical protein
MPSLSNARYRLSRRLGMTAERVVFIEGGLGTQLLGLMLFELRRSLDPRVTCDVSYFAQGLFAPEETAGATQRPWELDRYGFELDQFASTPNPRIRMRLSPDDQAAVDAPYVARLARSEWAHRIPPVAETAPALARVGLAPGDQFASVHVRRGDYLKVSSRVLSLEEVLSACQRLGSLLPENVFIHSDDDFTDREKLQISSELDARHCQFLVGGDQHVSHGIMRCSDVLVTANSTFSWTAALLSTKPHATALIPQDFFGPDRLRVNRLFQATTDWALMGQATP